MCGEAAEGSETTPRQVITVVSNTWTRDATELFDFESGHVGTETLTVQGSATLVRNSASGAIAKEDGAIAPPGAEALVRVVQRGGGFWVDRAASGSGQRLWSGHSLTRGDVFRLGRCKFRVRQVVAGGEACGSPDADLGLPDTCAACAGEGHGGEGLPHLSSGGLHRRQPPPSAMRMPGIHRARARGLFAGVDEKPVEPRRMLAGLLQLQAPDLRVVQGRPPHALHVRVRGAGAARRAAPADAAVYCLGFHCRRQARAGGARDVFGREAGDDRPRQREHVPHPRRVHLPVPREHRLHGRQLRPPRPAFEGGARWRAPRWELPPR
mmetsp:Transcript_48522/g.136506  ORF Transcript_48522/g.136506 Transcript_48522/m.136506 type:complete len:324 (+) Transcript_48522:45-1016(+)